MHIIMLQKLHLSAFWLDGFQKLVYAGGHFLNYVHMEGVWQH